MSRNPKNGASLICVCCHHASAEAVLADKELRRVAGRERFLVELRLDLLQDLTDAALDRLLDRFAGQALVTCRHPAEGGGRADLSDEQRVHWLCRAAARGTERGPAAIDFELRSRSLLPKLRESVSALRADQRPAVVVSFHDFQRVPDNLETVRREAEEAGADIVKIAVSPRDTADGLPLLKLVTTPGRRPLIGLAMGECGSWSRFLAPRFSAPWTYARLEGTCGTAPGQPSWRELEELYRFFEQRPTWPVYGVLGNPIAHSLSPLFHNTALRECRLPGVYLPFRINGDPVVFIQSFADALNLRGLSVTIPHKERVLAACDGHSPAVSAIGAANTLTRNATGSWSAENTDADAATDALEEKLGGPDSLRGKTILLLGAGGAGKALGFGLTQRGAKLLIANRTRSRAQEVADAVGGTVFGFEELPKAFAGINVSAVVNTTPLGMHPKVEASPLSAEQIPAGAVVFDTIYNPLRTKLLNLAQERGCPTLDGTAMFVGQGLKQFELWTGQRPSSKRMAELIREALARRAE